MLLDPWLLRERFRMKKQSGENICFFSQHFISLYEYIFLKIYIDKFDKFKFIYIAERHNIDRLTFNSYLTFLKQKQSGLLRVAGVTSVCWHTEAVVPRPAQRSRPPRAASHSPPRLLPLSASGPSPWPRKKMRTRQFVNFLLRLQSANVHNITVWPLCIDKDKYTAVIWDVI